MGRACGSFVADVTYEKFETGTVDKRNLGYYAVDVTIDACLSTVGYYYAPDAASKPIKRAIINGIIDAETDILETYCYAR